MFIQGKMTDTIIDFGEEATESETSPQQRLNLSSTETEHDIISLLCSKEGFYEEIQSRVGGEVAGQV